MSDLAQLSPRVIRNCYRLLRRRYRGRSLWVMVHEITGHGMGYSCEICLRAGFDPHQKCGAEELRTLPNPTEPQ